MISEATERTVSQSKAGRENLFTSNIRMVLDDDETVITEDVEEDFYRELILMYTVPSDTIIGVNPASRKCGKERVL